MPVQADRVTFILPVDSAEARRLLVDDGANQLAKFLFTENADCANEAPITPCLAASPEQHAKLMRSVLPVLESLPLAVDTSPLAARAEIKRRIPKAEPRRLIADARRLYSCEDWFVADSLAGGPCAAFLFADLYFVLSAPSASSEPDDTGDPGAPAGHWERLEVFLAKPGSSEGVSR